MNVFLVLWPNFEPVCLCPLSERSARLYFHGCALFFNNKEPNLMGATQLENCNLKITAGSQWVTGHPSIPYTFTVCCGKTGLDTRSASQRIRNNTESEGTMVKSPRATEADRGEDTCGGCGDCFHAYIFSFSCLCICADTSDFFKALYESPTLGCQGDSMDNKRK